MTIRDGLQLTALAFGNDTISGVDRFIGARTVQGA